MINLEQLGKRICIIGCSNSGKSTLAESLSKKLNIPAYHLDKYAHIENTNWQRDSIENLIEKNNDLIQQEAWIIDGNYRVCMESRFGRATSVIWLDPNIVTSVWRYILRSVKNNPNRPGGLAGAKNEFRFWLVKWILFHYPKSRPVYEKLIKEHTHLKKIRVHSMAELKRLYLRWDLKL